MSTSSGHRSLADQLRSWPDERLARLLGQRPDLTTPAPHDFGQLASRATTRASVTRALDTLTRLELCVLDALIAAGQTTIVEVSAIVPGDPDSVNAATQRLLDLCLVWEAPGGLRVVNVAREVLGSAPGADDVPPDVPDTPPEVAATERDQDTIDQVAAGAAFEAVRRLELLLDHWGSAPPAALRRGGLGVRDLRAAATHLHADEPTVALLLEVASGAGLLASRAVGDQPTARSAGGVASTRSSSRAGEPANPRPAYRDPGTEVWVPTDAFDAWCGRPAAERWTALARAWLTSPRAPGLVGTRDPSGKPWTPLAPELSTRTMAESRAMALAALRSLPEGNALAAGTGVASVVARVAWERPRRPRTRADEVAWTVGEAATLGVTGRDGLATYARVLLDGDDPAPALDKLLPRPVDHVLIQADLTAVAPGPLETDLARRLQMLAEVESRGGATVYRFTPDSMRRALDVGWTAAEIHEFIGEVSRTPVPQPLSYLVDDTVRTFGTIRVGYAEAFLRADDQGALTELLHHPKAASLGLRRLAPTVLISDTPIDVLLPRLRELGAAPVLEAEDGTVRVTRPDDLRARTPRDRAHPGRAARQTAKISSVITAVRAGDRAAASRPASTPTLSPSGALAALREAAETGTTVVIGYVDSHGTARDRVVDPVSVEGGQLTARDHHADDVRRFAVHRITTVRSA